MPKKEESVVATIEHITISEFKEKLNTLKLPSDTYITVTIEEKPGNKKRWDKQKALEAIEKLKGSGNGKLVEALLRDREKDKLL
jgi:hypothetical protein